MWLWKAEALGLRVLIILETGLNIYNIPCSAVMYRCSSCSVCVCVCVCVYVCVCVCAYRKSKVSKILIFSKVNSEFGQN